MLRKLNLPSRAELQESHKRLEDSTITNRHLRDEIAELKDKLKQQTLCRNNLTEAAVSCESLVEEERTLRERQLNEVK